MSKRKIYQYACRIDELQEAMLNEIIDTISLDIWDKYNLDLHFSTLVQNKDSESELYKYVKGNYENEIKWYLMAVGTIEENWFDIFLGICEDFLF